MRRIFIILSIVSVLPFAANAQLSKLMSKYHEKNGVTVTQLDKSLLTDFINGIIFRPRQTNSYKNWKR